MKFAVTGANGYIGRHVVKGLIEKDFDVVAVDLRVDQVDCRARLFESDILIPKNDVYSELGEPDVVIHLAWMDGFNHNSSSHMNNLSYHYRFVENLFLNGLRHLVVMGTMHEIGYHVGVIGDETPCNPISLYGIAKDSLRRSTFFLAKKYSATLQWLRVFYVLGDDKNNNSVFTKIISAEESGQALFPFSSGTNKYDFIHIELLTRMIIETSCQSNVRGIINCCSGKPIQLSNIVESFIQENGFKIKLDYGKFQDRPYDSPCVWGNTEKINKIMAEKE